jgi:hypothetical protein
LQIDNPVITATGANANAAVMPVAASVVAEDQFYDDAYKGSYVEVVGPFQVVATTPPEFAVPCPGMNGTRYFGFEISDGVSTVAVGFNQNQSGLNYCVADTCPGATNSCPLPITLGQTFSNVLGIVEAHFDSNSRQPFLRVSPVADSNLQP